MEVSDELTTDNYRVVRATKALIDYMADFQGTNFAYTALIYLDYSDGSTAA